MGSRLHLLRDTSTLVKKLAVNPVVNSDFLYRALMSSEIFRIYATGDMETAMAVQLKHRHMIFHGNWEDAALPTDAFPKRNFFVSASPPEAIALLREEYELKGEWPCRHFVAPKGFGPGPWDALGRLKDSDVSFIAHFWELGGDDREEHIRDCVRRYDSACIRVGKKPVAWCGLHFEIPGAGNLGFAHTVERHRRKGFAVQVTKALVNRLAARGARATAHVIKDNKASTSLCRSMGFRAIGERTWADFGRRL